MVFACCVWHGSTSNILFLSFSQCMTCLETALLDGLARPWTCGALFVGNRMKHMHVFGTALCVLAVEEQLRKSGGPSVQLRGCPETLLARP